ncbi:MAG: hypothetical protein RSB96_04050, partial [Oscillospiraceae bacterium]
MVLIPKTEKSNIPANFSQPFTPSQNTIPLESEPVQPNFTQDSIKSTQHEPISFSESFNEHTSITKDFAQEII